MDKFIYPDVKTIISEDMIQLWTFVRVKHRGKYYLWRIYHFYFLTKENIREVDITSAILRFNNEVYLTLILGKVKPNLKILSIAPGKVFELDPDQRSEKERVKSLIPIHLKSLT